MKSIFQSQKTLKGYINLFQIFLYAFAAGATVVIAKYFIHLYNFEPIEQSSLHNGVISSATFVIGFLLSATIADYKESERIPADFAANLEDMYEDAKAIHGKYDGFDLEGYRKQLVKIARKFDAHTRQAAHGVSQEIRSLSVYLAQMEDANVPANFVVKLKQQQLQMLRHRKRVNYIQRINFIPSATILARSITGFVIGLLILTNVDPFYGSLAIIGIITFVLVYMMILINTISQPFHVSGKTQDDVSMFLIKEAEQQLSRAKPTPKSSKN